MEAASTEQLVVPSELVLAAAGPGCRAHTCTQESKQGDFLLLPATSVLTCSRKRDKLTDE